jgi:hypothetical protein
MHFKMSIYLVKKFFVEKVYSNTILRLTNIDF